MADALADGRARHAHKSAAWQRLGAGAASLAIAAGATGRRRAGRRTDAPARLRGAAGIGHAAAPGQLRGHRPVAGARRPEPAARVPHSRATSPACAAPTCILVFLESYGAAAFDNADYSRRLQPRRDALAARAAGRRPPRGVGLRPIADLRRRLVAGARVAALGRRRRAIPTTMTCCSPPAAPPWSATSARRATARSP